ncbi:MAG: sodium:solute symporter family protein [Nitrospirae bacterium]|nr:sodium:solute symporter family protein [Nitrospirota bacterium]
MTTIHLAWVDWLVIAIYFAFIIAIGFYLKRFTKTGDDFFLAGRKNSAWVAGLAFLSANLGALEILGWTGATVKYGMFVAHFYWIGAVPAMLFLGLYMMPFYYSSKIHSIPGYLKLRFDEKTRVLNALSFAVMTVLMSGINMYLMALVFQIFLGWNFDACLWISAITVACYITMGGLLSAIFTETIQFFLIWFGLFLVAILGIVETRGELLTTVPEAMRSLWATSADPSMNPMGVTWLGIAVGLGFVLSFGYWTTDFLIVQRAFSAKDLRTAQMCPVIASFFKMALPMIVVGAGLVAWKLGQSGQLTLLTNAAGDPNYDSALPLLLARYYPHGLMGLGITALMAGFMAGQAGNISALNTVWTYDIYRAVLNRNASDQHLLWMGRVATLVGIVLSIGAAYWARQFPTIMDYIQAIFSWVNAPLFATMLLGMFWKRTTSAGAFYGLLAGMGASFLMFLGLKFGWFSGQWLTFSTHASDMSNNLWRAFWAWIICFTATIAISAVTKPKPDAELEGLVKALTKTVRVGETPLLSRPGFWAVISCVILVVLNVWFW